MNQPNILFYNTKSKIYPNFTKHIYYKTFKTKSLDVYDSLILSSYNSEIHTINKESDLERSIRRTKSKINDLVLCNNFDYFVTFTFKDDRQNVAKCRSKMHNWLKNQKKAYALSYIVIPEFHKDKKSLHFHALMSGLQKKHLKKTTKKINNRTVYNLTNYKSGFTTAIKIDNHQKVANYIKKYITKEMVVFTSKKRYWTSKNLKTPLENYNLDFNPNVCNKVYDDSLLTVFIESTTI